MYSDARPDGLPDRADPEWWEARYQAGDTPWHSGATPPEVLALIASERVARGEAVDLGCGSGVTSRHLAANGFRVVGIDFSWTALRRGTIAAREGHLACVFVRGNAADFRFAQVQATFAVDIGCFHSLTPAGRDSYRNALADTLQPGGYYLLYTFLCDHCAGQAADYGDAAARPSHETPAISYCDIAAFAPRFELRSTAHGRDRTRHSAWFLMQRA